MFLAHHYTAGMELEEWMELRLRPEEISRAEQVLKGGNSKLRYTRTFKGFLVNCYTPIEATLHGKPCVLAPCQGISLFVQDYESFRIPADYTYVRVVPRVRMYSSTRAYA